MGPNGRQQSAMTTGDDETTTTTTSVQQPQQQQQQQPPQHHEHKAAYIEQSPLILGVSRSASINQQGEKSSHQAGLYQACACCCSSPAASVSHHQDQSQEQPTVATKMPAQSSKSISTGQALACFIAELVGTFFLVLIGDGAVATFVLQKRPVDPFTACAGFGVGAVIAGLIAMKISGAHINPAASLALALDGRLRPSLLPVYMLAQYLGAFLAALVLFVNYGEAIRFMDRGDHHYWGTVNATGQIFATWPGYYLSLWGGLLDQIVGTAALIFALQAVGDRANMGLEERQQPFANGLIITFVCIAFLPNCGAILNPARDLAPRLLTELVGYQQAWISFGGLYWLTAALIGPHVGAILGLFGYKLLIGHALKTRNRQLHQEALDLQAANVEQPMASDMQEPAHMRVAAKVAAYR